MSDLRERVDGEYTCFNQYLLTDEMVCPTIRASSNDFIKVWKNIKLSEYELRQIWTFPLDYDFGKSSYGYVIWMSVPPLMMYQIIKRIIYILKK